MVIFDLFTFLSPWMVSHILCTYSRSIILSIYRTNCYMDEMHQDTNFQKLVLNTYKLIKAHWIKYGFKYAVTINMWFYLWTLPFIEPLPFCNIRLKWINYIYVLPMYSESEVFGFFFFIRVSTLLFGLNKISKEKNYFQLLEDLPLVV